MAGDAGEVPLDAIRVCAATHEEAYAPHRSIGNVTRLRGPLSCRAQDYLRKDLSARRGKRSELTDGMLFANTVAEPLDAVCFSAKRMRRRTRPSADRIVLRTSLSTFAYSLLICEFPSILRRDGRRHGGSH